MELGKVGLFTFVFDQLPAAQAVETLAEVEELGYGAVWIPEAFGKHPLVNAAILLGGTERIAVATGIANIYARDAMAMSHAHKTLTEAFPERFLLGLGVSHSMVIEGVLGREWQRPVAYMREYLDKMDHAMYRGATPTTEPRRCIGALGPKMLTLAGERTWGAHPYNVTPEHTAMARELMGPDALVAPEQAVVLDPDPSSARATAREALSIYLDLPNYTNNLKRLGFTEDDLVDRGSDRLIDALYAWGDVEAAAAAVKAHLDAGADHVAVQVIAGADPAEAIQQWRELAPALL